MAKGRLFNRLRDAIDNVQQNNRENPTQKTAPNQMFRRLQDQLANMQELQQEKREERFEARQDRQENRQERREQRRELKDEFRAQKNEMKQEWQKNEAPMQPKMNAGGPTLWDTLRQRMEQAKVDNEQRQDEPTADANVWDQLMGEIQKMEAQPTGQVQSQQQQQQPESARPTEARHNPWAPSGVAPIAQGVIISDGSVNLRSQPNMGAPRSEFRIQSGSVVNLVGEDKSNPVNLDGNVCGWCKVSVDGVEGWIPDAYLGSA